MTVRKRITTQKELMKYLDRLKPRYRIRMPLRDKRGPFLIEENTDVPGHTIQLRESTFEKVLSKDLLRVVNKVDTPYHCYYEYRLIPKKKRHEKKTKRVKRKTQNKTATVSSKRKKRTPKIKRKSSSRR